MIAASKSISLVSAIMSMFILQVAMINQFGDGGNMNLLNIISGSITSIATISVAVYMIINSKRKRRI